MSKRSVSQKGGGKLRTFVALLAAIFCGIYLYFNPELLDLGQQTRAVTGQLNVYYFDVGQGDSELIVAPDGECMLIDAGPGGSADRLVAELKSIGVKTLDYAVFTHPHEDHIGGADEVLRAFGAKTVIMPDVTSNTSSFERLLDGIADCGAEVVTASPGDTFALGQADLTVLAPCSDSYDGLNNYSVVVKLRYGEKSFLFTGDAESVSEKEMLNAFTASSLRADVLKVGHHGSSSSTTGEFLALVDPAFAVISCGENNDYGHPHGETLKKLKNITVYRTDLNGTVHITSDGRTVVFDTEK